MNQRDMRRAFAIMFSLLLVLGQWTSARPSAPRKLADACDACTCQMVTCCVAPATTPAPGNPAAPAPNTRVTEQQLVAALATAMTLLAAPVPVAPVSTPVHTADLSVSAVPIYCWNCTLLI